jgi:toxin ParE1/3/4
LAAEAEEDLRGIVHYIRTRDSLESAEYVLEGIERAMTSLEALPDRGHVPPELARVAVRGFREIHFKPYRVVYEVRDREIIIHAVLDGRRDLMTLLERRLTRR